MLHQSCSAARFWAAVNQNFSGHPINHSQLASALGGRGWLIAAKQTEKLVKIRDSALFASRSLGYKKPKVSKDLQLGVIKSFVGGKDVFAILPTGYVKR